MLCIATKLYNNSFTDVNGRMSARDADCQCSSHSNKLIITIHEQIIIAVVFIAIIAVSVII